MKYVELGMVIVAAGAFALWRAVAMYRQTFHK